MSRGVSTVIPRSILATAYTVQRRLERFEAHLASTSAGQGASLVGVRDAGGVFTGEDLESVLDELYTAATTAGTDSFTDSEGMYSTDTVNAAFAQLATILKTKAATELTLDAAGAITCTQSYHTIDTFEDAASDNADTIDGLVDGQFAFFRLADAARNVVFRSGIDNVICPGGFDVTLDATQDLVMVFRLGGFNIVFPVNLASLSGGGLGLALLSAADNQGGHRVGVYDANAYFTDDRVTPTLVEIVETFGAGNIPAALLNFAQQPADGNTIGIGADTYEFVDEAVNTVVNNDTHIAVTIGGDAATTLASLVAAINGTAAATHATITLADTVTPAIGIGTVSVVADALGTSLRIRPADAVGGTPTPSNPNILLAEAITDVLSIWNVGNVNLNTLGGRANTMRGDSRVQFAVTAEMIANTHRLDFPFVVSGFSFQLRSAAGAQLAGGGADAFTLDNDGILITFGGGIVPDLQATDIVVVHAWE